MTKSTKLTAAIVVMVATIAVIATATGSEAERATNTKPAPLSQIDLGSFIMETYANSTEHQDKLRHRKSFYKVVIRNKFIPDSSPLYTMKITNLAELVRCENLTLDQPEVEPLIDCRPLQSYVITDRIQVPLDPSNRHAMYAYRQSLKLKHRSVLSHDEPRLPNHGFGYQLRKDVARSRVEAFQKGFAKFEEQDFFGGYMETFNGPVKCSLNIFGSINATGLTPPVEAQPGLISMEDIMEFANGFSIIIEDLNCVDTESLLPFALHGDFKLTYQQEFPFLRVNHRMFTHPIREFFEFESEVRQTRDDLNINSFNTSVNIKSKSSAVEGLNFKLEQLFVDEDSNTGWETMSFVHPQLVAAVNSNRTLESFLKTLLVYLPTSNSIAREHPIFAAIFDDQKANDHLTISLRLRRDLFGSLFSISKVEEQSEARHQHEEL